MRASFLQPAFAVLLAFLAMAGNRAAAETLRLAGTGGVIEAMRQIAPPFAAATGLELEVIGGLGSTGAMRALSDGVIDVVVAARKFNPDEENLKLVSQPFARTPLVFITSHPKPNGLRSSDIAKLFASTDPRWEDGTPLRIILRTRVDADTAILERILPGAREAIAGARRRTDVPVAATDQDNVEFAQRLVGSFSMAGYGQIIAEKCNLRMIAIDGVVPSLATLANGTYPYEKVFYLVFAPERRAGAERLLRFLRSAEGHKALQATGNLPVDE
jgi:phosphate transport system substrate-binding protein